MTYRNESHLVYLIQKALEKHGACFRCHCGQFYTRSGQAVNGLPKGFSDLMCVLPGGKIAFIEAKMPHGRVSPEQKEFINNMQSMGAAAGVAYSVKDALKIIGVNCEQ